MLLYTRLLLLLHMIGTAEQALCTVHGSVTNTSKFELPMGELMLRHSPCSAQYLVRADGTNHNHALEAVQLSVPREWQCASVGLAGVVHSLPVL